MIYYITNIWVPSRRNMVNRFIFVVFVLGPVPFIFVKDESPVDSSAHCALPFLAIVVVGCNHQDSAYELSAISEVSFPSDQIKWRQT